MMSKVLLPICAFVGVVLVVAFVNACSLSSSPGEPNLTVTGKVTDSETGQPIVGARVADHLYAGSTTRPCQESWTDTEGRYALSTWYEEHTIVVSAPGYSPSLKTLLTQLKGQESTITMDLSLKKK